MGVDAQPILLMNQEGVKKISLKTEVGTLHAELDDKQLVVMNIGKPEFKLEKYTLIKRNG